jgi:flagellar basal body-associated protein FliL
MLGSVEVPLTLLLWLIVILLVLAMAGFVVLVVAGFVSDAKKQKEAARWEALVRGRRG